MTVQTAILPRKSLHAAAVLAKKVIERRNTIPVLSNIALRSTPAGFVTIATDLDSELRSTIADAAADSDFATTVPGHMLADLLKPSKAELIELRTSPDQITGVDLEGATAALQSLPISDFPEMVSFPYLDPAEIGASFDIESAVLRRAFEATQPSISTEVTRYYLNGVFMHKAPGGNALRFVSTDGHRMTVFDSDMPAGAELPANFAGIKNDHAAGVIIPRKAVATVLALLPKKGALPVRIDVSARLVRFTIGAHVFTSKTIDGTFPDYQRVMPAANDRRATFNRAELVRALETVSRISSGRSPAFRLSIGDGCAVLSVNDYDNGKAEEMIPCEWQSAAGPLEIGFNAGYVLTMLATLESEESVTFKLGDAGSPMRCDAAGGRLSVVVMPMRV